jgi:hypothetical protein
MGRSEDGDPLSGALVIRRRERPRAGGQWAAYGACVAAVSSAAVSLYWALGGTAGLGTVGGFAEKMARSGGAVALLIISVTVLLKTLSGLLALALARPWGLCLPRRALLIAGIGASAVLIIYGAAEVAAGALAETRAITPPGPVDWTALRWHLGLWDPWFLVWGLLLAAATRGYRRQPREVAVTGEGGVR